MALRERFIQEQIADHQRAAVVSVVGIFSRITPAFLIPVIRRLFEYDPLVVLVVLGVNKLVSLERRVRV